jgi:nickel-type superoxide dismutase maturation protease
MGRRREPRLAPVVVTGDSMRPTLCAGDFCLVVWGVRIRPGDVVVARLPGRPLGVKRAVRRTESGWWLEGDDSTASTDSRTFGAVPDEAVLGRVLIRYWPLAKRPVLVRRLAT